MGLGRVTSFTHSHGLAQDRCIVVRAQLKHPWCQEEPRATLDSLDSPRPGLGSKPPPYSLASKKPTTRLVQHSEHPWVLGLATGTWTHSPQPGLGSKPPPYSLGEGNTFPLCIQETNHKGLVLALRTPLGVGTSHVQHGHTRLATARTLGEVTTFPLIVYSVTRHGGGIQMAILSRDSRDSRVGVPKSRIFRTPAILRLHNFRSRPPIDSPSEAKLQVLSRPFQRYVARFLQPSISGRFSTFSGRESKLADSRDFDSQAFFWP